MTYFVGGEDNQKYLIGKQIEVDLNSLSCERGFAKHLSDVYDCCILIGKTDMQFVENKFWLLFEDCKSDTIGTLNSEMSGVKNINVPMRELIDYHEGILRKSYFSGRNIERINKEDGYGGSRVIKAMKSMIKEYIDVVISKAPRPENNEYYDPYVKCSCGYWHHFRSARSKYGSHPYPNQYIDCWEWNEATKHWRNKHTNEYGKGTSHKDQAFPSLFFCH